MNVRIMGLQPYESIWQQMQRYTTERTAQSADQIWLLEHPPIYTLGKRDQQQLLPKETKIPWITSDRGGEITYHGPGQLVAYLLLDLRRRQLGIKELVHQLEQTLIEFLSSRQIAAHRRTGMPGIYVNNAKIASLGLRVRRGCSYHGVSLNVNMDLSPFSAIAPCGYPELKVTQMADFDPSIEVSNILHPLKSEFEKQFQLISQEKREQ